jgi:hypothetical protein
MTARTRRLPHDRPHLPAHKPLGGNGATYAAHYRAGWRISS